MMSLKNCRSYRKLKTWTSIISWRTSFKGTSKGSQVSIFRSKRPSNHLGGPRRSWTNPNLKDPPRLLCQKWSRQIRRKSWNIIVKLTFPQINRRQKRWTKTRTLKILQWLSNLVNWARSLNTCHQLSWSISNLIRWNWALGRRKLLMCRPYPKKSHMGSSWPGWTCLVSLLLSRLPRMKLQ